MGSNPSLFKRSSVPVDHVSWDDCKEFCEKVGLALPSEAQWEYACRAGTTGPHAGNVDDMAWYVGNAGSKTHPVGTKAPNAFGLHDMHGNVWEWCEDEYDSSFYGTPGAGDTDAVASSGSEYRVIRGASWGHGTGRCRSASRSRDQPGKRSYDYGLRPSMSSR